MLDNRSGTLAEFPDDFDDLVNKIKSMTPEERQSHQEWCRISIGNRILALAAHVKVIQSENGDLEMFRDTYGKDFVAQLQKVADGILLPEMVRRYAGRNDTLLTLASNLPHADQLALAAGKPQPLVVVGPEGKPDVRMRDPLTLKASETRQLIGRNRIRDRAEQEAELDRLRMRIAVKRPDKIGRAKLDHERSTAKLPGGEYTLAELVEIVKALRS